MTNAGDIPFHNSCFACGSANDSGLRLKFESNPAGSSCTATMPARFQSYDGMVHGGIVATLLDSAMVHALKGVSGEEPMTCRLEIRYLNPVCSGEPLTVHARRTGNKGRVVLAAAEVTCSGVCCARAHGAFIFR